MATITGSNGNDTLRGTNDTDTIRGLRGNDTLEGLGGADQLDGGPGSDTADYAGAPAAVSVNLANGIALDGYGTTDTIISIGHVNGSDHNDTIIGNDNVNHLSGGEGDDTVEGGGGDDVLSEYPISGGNDTFRGGDGDDKLYGGSGDDILDGGAGSDMVTYAEMLNGDLFVSVDLATGTARDQWGGSDTIISVGNLVGSYGSDTLAGNDNDNIIDGLWGDDTIDGRGGADTIDGFFGNDTVDLGVDQARDVFDYVFGADGGPSQGFYESDIVRNFEAGEDVLRLQSGITDPDVLNPLIAVQDDGNDTRLTFDDGETITLVGVTQSGSGSFDSLAELVSAGIIELA